MSIFDRIGNLGKGIIQSTLNPDTPTDNSGKSRHDQLQQAFNEGLLTADEYRKRLQELSARLAARARGEDPDEIDSTEVGEIPHGETSHDIEDDPVIAAIRRSKTEDQDLSPREKLQRSLDRISAVQNSNQTSARSGAQTTSRTSTSDSTTEDDASHQNDWEKRGPVKRTL